MTQFRIVGREPDPARKFACRRMLVGPWYNQPEQYPGYNGFVGWAGLAVLRSGRWLLTFNSGYWHANLPVTDEILKDPDKRRQFDLHLSMGCPDVRAPRGGRTHLMQSDDNGLTWSKPTTLIDTEHNDLHAMISELNNGTLLCSFYTEDLPNICQASYMLSNDQAKTWSEIRLFPNGASGVGNESAIQLSDGTVLHSLQGRYGDRKQYDSVGIFRSKDYGETFELSAVIGSLDHHLHEQSLAELDDGRLVMMARAHGDIAWSDDKGLTWTDPVSTGISMYDPHLLLLPNGVLALFFGSYFGGGVRVCLSKDGGKTWHGPGDSYGYDVDCSAYGYSHPVLLKDGTIYVLYQHTGGHKTHHARTEALWGIRVRVFDDADGIEILPAPGSPGHIGYAEAYNLVVNEDGPRSHRPAICRSVKEMNLAGEEVFDPLWKNHELVAELPLQGWKFKKDREVVGEQKGWHQHDFDDSDWENIEIGDWWDAFGHHHIGFAWYRLKWEAPLKASDGRRLKLAFGAVDGQCWIYIDGKPAGESPHGPEGWDQPFQIDVTERLQPGQAHLISIKVKNTVGPAGIWRTVKLVSTANHTTAMKV